MAKSKNKEKNDQYFTKPEIVASRLYKHEIVEIYEDYIGGSK